MSNPLFQLKELGQSVWYDEFARSLVREGGLKELHDRYAVVGVTTNPSIFEKAIGESADYDEDLRRLAESGASAEEMFMELALDDVGRALDILAGAYEQSGHLDGRVSMEVLASLAYDTEGTERMVRDIWRRVNRPNLMVKIPATSEGIPAIEQMLYEGHNINITLIFGLDYYRQVMEAYVSAIERRLKEGKPVEDISSVASFFVSRVDTKVDRMLDSLVEQERLGQADADRLKGRAAVANARLAYEMYRGVFHTEHFDELRRQGARVQRPLWASTSTKNPAYSDILYVDELVGAETVNTLPKNTLLAYADHGRPEPRIEDGVEEARALMEQLAEVGIDMQKVTDELIDEGVKAFEAAFQKLLGSMTAKAGGVAAGK